MAPVPVKKRKTSCNVRAKLSLGLGAVRKVLRAELPRVGPQAVVSLGGLLEYCTSDLLRLASESATAKGKKTVCVEDVGNALQDEDWRSLLKGVHLQGGGCQPRTPILDNLKVIRKPKRRGKQAKKGKKKASQKKTAKKAPPKKSSPKKKSSLKKSSPKKKASPKKKLAFKK
eukprot:TRINITY_DN33073_c0_g1_i1.p1 TRINITY_DN33073_c0_g1~~TRINITY_DN33073_c0_g1_i1.p1  ORF type:complete len:172 (+),score=23.21 TRINITY_DN33073_c0_g1_i1:314-829(+)